METSLWQQILLIAILIGVNAFFAATEIAMISLNSAKLKKLIEEGDKKAAKILPMVEEPSGFLSTIQIGITLAGFLASAFAADNFSGPLVEWITQDMGFTAIPVHTLDTIAVIVITIILSYFTLVFGELVPKRVAMQKSLFVAKAAIGVISVIALIVRPVIWFLAFSTNTVLRLFRLKTDAQEESVTEEEVRFMIDLGEEKGTIQPKEKELIENVFELNDRQAKDVMTHRMQVEAIDSESTPEEIFRLVSESGWSRFPVYQDNINNVIGMLITKEFLISYDDGRVNVKELIRPAYFVPETVPADVLFYDMQKKKIHLAVVVDEYGETSGIVTMEDLLEEIVGNIYDESDEAEEVDIAKVGENLWRVAGSVEIDRLEDALEIEFPEDVEFQTVGGLVFSQILTIPEDGSKFEVEAYGLKIKVEKLEERRVEWTYISKLLPEEEQEKQSSEKEEN